MGVTVATTRVAASIDTAPYTQDITTADLGGLTPKGVLLIVTKAVTDGTAIDNYVFSYGAATGAANEWCKDYWSRHGVGTSDGYTSKHTDACITMDDPSDGSEDAQAEFSSFITNGVRINWTNAPSAAYLITAVLFAGTDLSAHADSIGIGNTTDLETNCEQPGFEPDVLFTSHLRNDGIHAVPAIGLVHNDGDSTITERFFWARDRDGKTTSEANLYIKDDYGVGNYGDWYGEFLNFDADGFSMITRLNGGNNSDIQYLALSFGGAVASAVGTHTTPTSTGNDAETGPGFTPQFVYMITHHGEALNTYYIDDTGGSIGLSTLDANDEYSNTFSYEDAVGTTNNQSLSDDRAVALPADDGTLDIEAEFVSFDANGWTLNYTNAPSGAKLWFYLAIEAEAAAGVEVTVPLATLVLTGYAPTVAVTENVDIEVPVASLTLTGYAPTVETPVDITVPLGTLTITGYAPTVTVTENVNIEVPAASLTLTGYVPTVAVTADVDIEIPAGTLVLTGYAPTVTASGAVNIEVPAGSLVLTGYAPTVTVTENIDIEVPAGSLVLTGYAPVVGVGVTVDVPLGTLVLTGFAPTVTTTANVAVEVPVGSLVLTGYAPEITAIGADFIGKGPPKRKPRRDLPRRDIELPEKRENLASRQARESLRSREERVRLQAEVEEKERAEEGYRTQVAEMMQRQDQERMRQREIHAKRMLSLEKAKAAKQEKADRQKAINKTRAKNLKKARKAKAKKRKK